MEKNDQQLIEDFLGGDERALDFLISRHLKPVYNFVWRLCGNKHEAQDITQEVFVKVWKNLKKYQPERDFRTWLFTIARNTAFDWLRKKKHLVFSEFENEEGENVLTNILPDPAPLADELFASAENKKILEEKLDRLSPIYREVLLLRYNNDFTFEEMGKILNIPTNTVKSRHRRALAAIEKLLTSSDIN